MRHFDMISKMNSSGAHLWMPLHYVAYRSNEDMARLLVGNGANVNCQNVNGQTPGTAFPCQFELI